MARRGQRQSGARRTAPRQPATCPRPRQRRHHPGARPRRARGRGGRRSAGRVRPSVRTKFQVVALLVREERARVKADEPASRGPPRRAAQAPRRDRDDPGEDRRPRHLAARAARRGRRRLRRGQVAQARHAAAPPASSRPPTRSRTTEPAAASAADRAPGRAAVGRLAPAGQPLPRPRLLGRRPSAAPARAAWPTWELLGPLFRSFEQAGGGASPCMALPEPSLAARRRAACELMPHQAQVVAAAAAGHRTFLLADEPGLGKTAQALLAAQAANAYPLLVVVPNVVKTNWAREAGLWTPNRAGHRDPRRRRRRSTASPTSSSSTTRCSTGTSAGSATSASAAWSSTRRTSSRTRRRSARSTCCELSERIRARIARPAADGADRHAADQRHRGLPGDLAVPRLDRRQEAAAPR